MRLATLVLTAMLAAGAAKAAPLEAYGKLPVMDMVSVSPDGARIAFVTPVNGKQAVVVDQLNPTKALINMPSPQKVRNLTWADPDHLLVTVSEERNQYQVRAEWSYVMDIDLQQRKITQLLRKAAGIPAVVGVPDIRVRNGHTTVFAQSYIWKPGKYPGERFGAPALVSSDLVTGDEVVETSLEPKERALWILDDQGGIAALGVTDETTGIWSVMLHPGAAWTPAYRTKQIDEPSEIVGLTPDGGSLLLELYVEGRGYFYQPVAMANGKLGAAENNIFGGFSDLIRDPLTGRIIGGRRTGLEPTYAFFDKTDQAAWERIVGFFPDEYVDFISRTRDHGKIVVRVTGLRHGVVYELVDVPAGKVATIGQAYQGIAADDLADVRIATYAAKDGRPIKALLTLPNGRDPKNLPLVVLPHGGPADHDEARFDWLAQALASRGYAVLQPQFRGSTGFGWALEAAGFGEWGRKMQSDLSDGVRALASQGYVDPRRVCIVGASYGGYAALAGVTIEQGVYRCAVAVAGVSDLSQQIGGPKADAEHSSLVRYWDRFIGAKDPKDPVLEQFSPANHADAAAAPILLIHGKDDTVVPIAQSQMMERALRRANKPVEFVALKEEDHWLSREPTRTQMLEATVAFLEKNNPPQ